MNQLVTIALLMTPILLCGAMAFRLPVRQDHLRLILAFSAGYLFSLAIMHMLPEVFAAGQDTKFAGLFIVIGFVLQLAIDTFSTGIEHGHTHLHSHQCHDHLPYGIIIGLFLHSFLEGLPVYDLHAGGASHVNYQLILGLGIHNLPITIAFVALLREHEKNSGKTWLLLLAFAFMTPLGYLAGYTLQSVGLRNYQLYSQCAYALVIGIFLHISTAILFESGVEHRYNLKKVTVLTLGIVLAYLIS